MGGLGWPSEGGYSDFLTLYANFFLGEHLFFPRESVDNFLQLLKSVYDLKKFKNTKKN